jgi:hypothetical protein
MRRANLFLAPAATLAPVCLYAVDGQVLSNQSTFTVTCPILLSGLDREQYAAPEQYQRSTAKWDLRVSKQ